MYASSQSNVSCRPPTIPNVHSVGSFTADDALLPVSGAGRAKMDVTSIAWPCRQVEKFS